MKKTSTGHTPLATDAGKADHTTFRLAVTTAAATFLLLVMGSLVTGNTAGDSVPDWPLAFGTLVPVAQLAGKVIFEYFHRVTAAVVALLVVALTVTVFRRERRNWVKWVTASALVAVIAQAVLGGLRVILGEEHGEAVAMIHAFLAQAIFALTVSIALFQSESHFHLTRADWSPQWLTPRIVSYSITAGIILLIQILLGAAFRHGLLSVAYHAIAAVVVVLLLGGISGMVIGKAKKSSPDSQAAARTLRLLLAPARILSWLLLVQLALGVVTYLLLRAAAAAGSVPAFTVAIASAHLAVGALIVAVTIVLILRFYVTGRVFAEGKA